MKEAIIVDLEGYDTYDRTLVTDNVTGVFPILEPEQVEEEEEQTDPEMITVGYTVAIKPPEGLYKLRYDLDAYHVAMEQYEQDTEAWREEMRQRAEEAEEDEEIEYLPPPAAPDLSAFWVEGYTAEELEELLNPPPGPPTPIEQLQQQNAQLLMSSAQQSVTIQQQQDQIAALLVQVAQLQGGAS